MRFVRIWALVCLAVFLVNFPAWAAGERRPAASEDSFQAGREYVELPGRPVRAEPDDGRIEVIVFFWYGCPHCYAVDQEVAAWAAKLPPDVRFVRLPASFNAPVDFHARIFFTLEALGYGHEMDLKVFSIFLDEGRFINTGEDLAGLAKDLKIDQALLLEVFNSPAVQAKMNALDKLMAAYDLPGVPAMVVNGKYRFDIGTANGPEGFLRLADFLIAKERRDRPAPPKP